VSLGVFGDTLLVVACVEDRRSIAEPHIIALAIARCRVVDLEEKLEKLAVADLAGIEDDLNGFGVGSMIAVGRIHNVAAGVADAREITPSYRRIRSCMPQKQPPARTARSSLIGYPPPSRGKPRSPCHPYHRDG
jgi:hypothetical protein